MDYSALDDLIDELEAEFDDLPELPLENARAYRALWDSIKQIGSSFRDTRYPSRGDKDAAWNRFQRIVDSIKSQQPLDRYRNERNSEEVRGELIELADEASPIKGPFAELNDMLYKLLIEPLAILFTFGLVDFASEHQQRKQELLQLSDNLKEAWAQFSSRKNEMFPGDRQVVYERLREVQGELDDAWTQWKEAADRLNEARDEARQEQIDTLEERIERLRGVLDHKQSHLEDLYEKRDSAWSDDYRDRVEGWIQEEEDAVSDIEAKIDRLEGYLAEARSRQR